MRLLSLIVLLSALQPILLQCYEPRNQVTRLENTEVKARENYKQNPWQTSGAVEGDMIFENTSNPRVISKHYPPWPHHEIPYVLDATYRQEDKDLIKKVLDGGFKGTCIVPRLKTEKDKDYIFIKNSRGCVADVDYRNQGEQGISLEPGRCITPKRPGIILHEFLHSLGFYHEQSSPDRDDYIEILFMNIRQGFVHEFEKKEATSLGEKYDYDSIMHYDEMAYTCNNKPTMRPKNASYIRKLGTTDVLSRLDIVKINKFYKCNTKK